jgi:hypothetical protein
MFDRHGARINRSRNPHPMKNRRILQTIFQVVERPAGIFDMIDPLFILFLLRIPVSDIVQN